MIEENVVTDGVIKTWHLDGVTASAKMKHFTAASHLQEY